MDMGKHVEKHEAQKEHINKHKIAHMIGVAEYMRNNAPKYNLHPEAMYTLGLLHDIGYLYGRQQHESLGAEMLICNVGINDEIYFAIKQHGRCVNDINTEFEDIYTYHKELFLLLEADMSIDANGHYVGFNGRLNDIANRYGIEHPAYETALQNIKYIKNIMDQKDIKIISPGEAERNRNREK